MVTVVNMYAVGEDGSEVVLEPFGGVYQVAGGNFPAQVWHDYMVSATADMAVESFPSADQLVSKRAPRTLPAPEPTQEPTEETPSEEPSATEEPKKDEPATDKPEVEPSPSQEPTSDPSMGTTPAPGGDSPGGERANGGR